MNFCRLAVAVAALSVTAGITGSPARAEVTAVLPVIVDLRGFARIHDFHAPNGTLLACLYGKSIDNELFSELLIVDADCSTPRVIYLMDRNRFVGVDGVEMQPESANFFAYRIEMKAADYIVVNCTSDHGVSVSDDVTVRWNYERQTFGLEKTP